MQAVSRCQSDGRSPVVANLLHTNAALLPALLPACLLAPLTKIFCFFWGSTSSSYDVLDRGGSCCFVVAVRRLSGFFRCLHCRRRLCQLGQLGRCHCVGCRSSGTVTFRTKRESLLVDQADSSKLLLL